MSEVDKIQHLNNLLAICERERGALEEEVRRLAKKLYKAEEDLKKSLRMQKMMEGDHVKFRAE